MNTSDQSENHNHDVPDWHALATEAALRSLDSAPDGLSTPEAGHRLERNGPNRLPEPERRPAWRRLLAQFNNVLIYALIAAAAAALALDHALDAAVIAAVVIINAIIGFVQEGRAEAAMAAIDKMLAQTAEARRDGRWCRVPAEQLVIGDIVRIDEGDRVPADLRLIESHGLRVEQAALTGESVPVSKSTGPVAEDAGLADRRCMAYSGTLVAGGQAIGVVAATGTQTEIGRISTMLGEVEQLTTPLIRQINRFGHHLTILLIVVTALVIGAGRALHGMALAEGLVAGVALIVAAIPEGLPAIITITLAIGVRRMASRNAVIRRLPAVETLGSVTVICSDKTGTLTQNRLRAAKLLRDGDIVTAAEIDISDPAMMQLLRVGVLCNNADSGGGAGDPLELALLELAEAAGLDVERVRREAPRTGLVPFSSSTKWMASLHADGVMVKGAPEVLIEGAVAVLGPGNGETGIDRNAWRSGWTSWPAKATACSRWPTPVRTRKWPRAITCPTS